jgi:phosphocarrier protein FPr/phosphocarrier protein
MYELTLKSPLDGWSAPLEEVPDEVFATRMLGDGVAIDPTGSALYAPCDGELIVVPASKHAVTIRADNGAEILLHVGIDTVNLRGEGFELHVAQGDRVKVGDKLISFDLDLIARSAKSAITPLIVANGDRFQIARKQQDCAVKVGDEILELVALAEASAAQHASSEKAARSFIVGLEHGVHARPAALFASTAKRFASNITVQAHGRKSNGKSAVSLMALRIRFGDEALVEAVGPDAEQAVAVLEALIIATGKAGSARSQSPSPEPPVVAARAVTSTGVIKGVCASGGLAVGQAFQLTRPQIDVDEAGQGASQEHAVFDRAQATLKVELQRRIESSQGAQRSVAEAHLEFLEDPELLHTTQNCIAQGKSAGFAWRQSIQSYVSLLSEADDPRIRERRDDLLDLEAQLLLAITGQPALPRIPLPENAIVLAQDLLPSQISLLDPARLAGICTAGGGPTSHVAILAAAMGVPALVAAGGAVLGIPDGSRLIIDADNGTLAVDPKAADLDAAEKTLVSRRARRAAEQAIAQRECRTADGHRIEIFANVGAIADAKVAVAEGAEGCGLLRTEFLFLDRQTPPDEAEQAAQYQAIASAFAPRPVIIRTLDIGGDKPIAYLPLPHEENPALGLRGVRTSLWRMDLLRTQLRAVLSVRPAEQCKLLLPMITSPAEVRAIRAALKEVDSATTIQVGVMIETPASAVIADQLVREADFLSIGTNDLTQYTLAMDRGHPELAAQLDALHPAVLRLIASAAKAGRAHNKLVAVCGGLASDPLAAPVLIGLGVNELSTIPSVIPRLKALISSLSMDECREIASRALEQTSAEDVRALLNEHATDKAGAPA